VEGAQPRRTDVDITPKPMTDDQWRYWEERAERAAKESPADVRSAQEVAAELATYMLVDADRNFVSL
jgi:hypothetical protein